MSAVLQAESIAFRRATHQVRIRDLTLGSSSPVVVQSMTNTPTADITATVAQIKELVSAGSEIVRLTVNDAAAAKAVPAIVERLEKSNLNVPLVGDFHYNGHRLLSDDSACAQALSKYRINPGNIGAGEKRDSHFASIVEIACRYDKPVRIGVNWGSLDSTVIARIMDENGRRSTPAHAKAVMQEALIVSALESATQAEKYGLPADHIVLSAKVSAVQDLISVYRELAKRCMYPLHLGLTEAGMGDKGVVATTAALAVLLQQGIGDTIRISLTPEPDESRTREVIVAQQILQSMGLRAFSPVVIACPGCGRTSGSYFQELAATIQSHLNDQMRQWKERYHGVETMSVAVMGCIVNGPGESRHADIGISLPGSGESPAAPVYVDGVKVATLRGENIAREFIEMIDHYVADRYSEKTKHQ